MKRDDSRGPRRNPSLSSSRSRDRGPSDRSSESDDHYQLGPHDEGDGPEDDIDDAEFVEGSAEARPMLFKWMKGILDGPDCEQGFQATLCIAANSTRNGRDKSIRGLTYALDMDLIEFVNDIVNVADDVVRKHKREVRFAVRIPVGGRPAERKHFTLTVNHDDFSHDDNTFGRAGDYGSDATALVAQAVDHTEVFAREMVGVTREGLESLRETIREKKEEIRELKEENRMLRREREEVRDMQWALDDARDDRRHEREQKDRLFRGMMQGGKYLLASIAGGGGLPGIMSGAMPPGMAGGSSPMSPMGQAMFGSVGGGAADPTQSGAAGHPAGCVDDLHHALVAIIGDFFAEATSEQIQRLVAADIFPPSQLERIGQLHKLYFALQERVQQQAQYAARAEAQRPPPGSAHGPPNGYAPNGSGGEVQR